MPVSIDTNVIAALWNRQDPFSSVALKMLSRTYPEGGLVISGPVYAELLAGPLREEAALDRFFVETGISVEWTMEEKIWREAGKAFRSFAHRRRSAGGAFPRRLLADFLIGAHAAVRGHSLLTFDQRLYSAAFPKLRVIAE